VKEATLADFFKSFKFKLVLLSMLICGAPVSILSVFLFNTTTQTQAEAFDQALYNHAVDVANGIDLTYLGELVLKRDALVGENKIFPFPLGQSVVQIRAIDGSVLLSSRALGKQILPLAPVQIETLVNRGTIFDSIDINRTPYRIVAYLIDRSGLPPLVLQIAVPTHILINERKQLSSLFWILVPLVLLSAAVSGLLLARNALVPVSRMIKTARSIQASGLASRVPVPEETELKELAVTLNDLLLRLQRAFTSQEQFIADASHQIKTPLAIIRGEIDVNRHATEPAAQSSLLESISQEVDHLSHLVDDLLTLARFDNGNLAPEFRRVRIDEVLLDAIAQVNPFARMQKVDISFSITDTSDGSTNNAVDFEVKADAELLQALFFNLLENSIKYTSKPGKTEIRLTPTLNGWLDVEVEDHGLGISADDQVRIFDRFFRASSNHYQTSGVGVGLGLSIASRIAKFHDAELAVKSQLGVGTIFYLRIKKF
jgi:signal transduction histidine kinase